MTRYKLIILFSFFSKFCVGQDTVYHAFTSSDFPTDKYEVSKDTFSFKNYKIVLIQSAFIGKNVDGKTFYCRVWLTVLKGKEEISKLYYPDCDPVGGCFGVFFPKRQPRKDYFILSKFGDYNGQVLLIDSTGKITSIKGGHFSISNNKKFLFSQYDSDIQGVSVYDLSTHTLLFSSELETEFVIDGFYVLNEKYVALLKRNSEGDEETNTSKYKISTFDFASKKFNTQILEEKLLEKLKRLETYYTFPHKCNCGKTN